MGYYLRGKDSAVVSLVREILALNGHECELIYSHGLFLDILPKEVSKGYALRYLQNKLAIPNERTLAAGDSINDKCMLSMAGAAIVVANGAKELEALRGSKGVFFARKNYAAGLLEGLAKLEDLGWRKIQDNGWQGGSLAR